MRNYKIFLFICLLCAHIFSFSQALFAAETPANPMQQFIFYYNNDTNAIFTQYSTNMNEIIIPAEIPERSGYTFLGWATQPEAALAEYQPNQYFRSDAELITFYAVWLPQSNAYTLVYNANGGENAPPDETVFSPTSSCKFKISRQKPQRLGYNFLGWSLDPDAQASEYTGGNELRTASRQTILYAVWQAKPPITFHLIYHANGGDSQPDNQNQKAPASGCLFLISNQQPEREGYIFLGWATNPQANHPEYQPGEELYTSVRTT